jgi:formate-dependent nitrite reductase membrane component NrfD
MTEVDIGGANPVTYPELSTWQWEVALYLFLGGLVAGLMIMGPVFKLLRPGRFNRALVVADVAGLPLLGAGMLLLWIDLANRWNAWRFFLTLQVTSPMSWGSWILLLSMVALALRLLSHLPMPDGGERVTKRQGKASIVRRLRAALMAVWRWLAGLGQRLARSKYALDGVTLALGLGLGFYTGVLLSSIAARPLWNSSVLAPLFLVSGLASAGAFLCLFIPKDEHESLAPFSVLVCAVELLLIVAYAITLATGGEASQRAGGLIFGGEFTLLFWGAVVLIGLLLPVSLEAFELAERRLPALLSKLPPVLKLAGSIGLRMVIVYAGLRSFV